MVFVVGKNPFLGPLLHSPTALVKCSENVAFLSKPDVSSLWQDEYVASFPGWSLQLIPEI